MVDQLIGAKNSSVAFLAELERAIITKSWWDTVDGLAPLVGRPVVTHPEQQAVNRALCRNGRRSNTSPEGAPNRQASRPLAITVRRMSLVPSPMAMSGASR